MDRPAGLGSLPIDILSNILSRVPIPEGHCEDLAKLAMVSKSFERTTKILRIWSVDVTHWEPEKRSQFEGWVAKNPSIVDQLGIFVAAKSDWDWIDKLFELDSGFSPRIQIDTATWIDDLLVPLVHRLREPSLRRWFTNVTHLCLDGDENELRVIFEHLAVFPQLEEIVIQFRTLDLAIDLEPDRDSFPIRAPLPPKLRVLLAEDAVGRISRSLAPILPQTIEEVALYLAPDVIDSLPEHLPNLHTIVASGSVTGNVLTDLVSRCPKLQVFSMPIHCFGCDITNLEQFKPNQTLHSFSAWVMDVDEMRSDLPLWDSSIREMTIRIEDGDICEFPKEITKLPLTRLQIESPGTLFLPDLSPLDKLELFVIKAVNATLERPPHCQMIIETDYVSELDDMFDDVEGDDTTEGDTEIDDGEEGNEIPNL